MAISSFGPARVRRRYDIIYCQIIYLKRMPFFCTYHHQMPINERYISFY